MTKPKPGHGKASGVEDANLEVEARRFSFRTRGMPLVDTPADHIGVIRAIAEAPAGRSVNWEDEERKGLK